MSGLGFGARVPFFYSSLRYARVSWLQHCCHAGYLKRGITLSGGMGGAKRVVYERGSEYAMLPRVVFRCLTLTPTHLSVETDEDFGIEE